jgi:TonB-dependent starch-binding outer membrane protein SusC
MNATRLRLSLFVATACLLVARASAIAQSTGTIQGTVTIEGSARPLGSVQVTIARSPLGTQTDDAGAYRLTNVPTGMHEVRFQRIGYAPVVRQVTVDAGAVAALDVALRDAPVSLDQIVVTATGEQRKKEIPHALSTISAEDIQDAPVSNTQQLITARAPGVTVLANSGQPGSGGLIKLRGTNSISQGNNPLIYVDGVRIYSGTRGVVGNARQTTLPLNDLHPEDIERVEIVKGAAATTLYGTEASGGVIQIFTKRGRAGAPEWALEVQGGTNDLESMGPDGDQTGLFVRQCRGDGLRALDVVQSTTNSAGVTTPNPRFGQDVIFEDPTCPASGSWLKTGVIQRYSGSVRGGAQNVRYFLSANVGEEEGALRVGGLKDGGFRGNFGFNPISSLDFQINSSYTRRNLEWVPDGNLANGFLLNVGRGPNNNFKGGGCSAQAQVCLANAEIFKLTTESTSDHFITGFTVKHTPSASLTNRLTLGYDFNNANNESVIAFGHLRNPAGQILVGDWRRTFLSVDYASTWSHAFATALASSFSWGGQIFADNLRLVNVQGDEFAGGDKPTLITAARRTVTADTRQRTINAGFFFQEQLNWNDRLVLTAGVRVDGNSAFGEDFGLQAYPKVGLAYTISDHAFWPARWLETFKLRAAFGESGKAPGAFDAARNWTPIAGDEAKPGLTPNQIGNANLGPERTRELELGFEASALEGRVNADFTYYTARTVEALIQVTYPPSQGWLDTQLENLGELQNSGIEMLLEAGLLQFENLDWRARVNFTSINSEARELGGQPEISIGDATVVRVGFPVPSFFGRRVLNPDALAEPIISEDVEFLGSTYPDKIIGLGSNVTLWKRLKLDALGELQRGGANINYIGYQNALRGVWFACIPVQRKLAQAALGNAAAVADVTARDRARCAIDRTLQNSNYWIESTDFFKLRYVSATYTLPNRWIRGAKTASFTLAGRNLWTSTDYTGLDPESADLADDTFARREYYQLPAIRSFIASFRVTF